RACLRCGSSGLRADSMRRCVFVAERFLANLFRRQSHWVINSYRDCAEHRVRLAERNGPDLFRLRRQPATIRRDPLQINIAPRLLPVETGPPYRLVSFKTFWQIQADTSAETTSAMRHRVIHLINPKTDSLTTRPLYLNRALYSPLAGLLAVAGAIPRDRYEVVLTDENIEPIDFDLRADLVGISAMTAYVNRGYEIADAFRARGVPVVMGGVHPSFMPQEALKHCDAVVIGEAEL